jgi:hypothetical protein
MDQSEQVDGRRVGPTAARLRVHPLRLTPGLAEQRRGQSPHEGAAVAALVGLLLLAIFVVAAFVGVLAQTVAVLVALVTACTALTLLRTRVIAERTQLSAERTQLSAERTQLSAERTQLSAERTASINDRIAQLQLKKTALELNAASLMRIDPPKAGPQVDDVVLSRLQDKPPPSQPP